MTSRFARHSLATLAILTVGGASALAQSPTINPDPLKGGSTGSLLGNSPGQGAYPLGTQPGSDQATLGGRAGTSASRAPASITTPGTSIQLRASTIRPPDPLKESQVPAGGSLDFPDVIDDEGPADGLTLDSAIERLVRENLFLRAASFEIPQADADILTASLRANPVFYADSQLIPYGSFNPKSRPGGQTQYDVNISYPLDVSGKRKARIVSASRAKSVLEQQYRDAVRVQIDNLYTAYVDVQAAKATLRFSQSAVEGLDRILVPIESKFRQGAIKESDYLKVAIQRESAEIGRRDAEESLRKAKRILGNLLNFAPEQADGIELRAALKDGGIDSPPSDALFNIAMESRPDLAAYRLGVCRAEADVKLAVANKYQDIYVLYQPYTFQDNQPTGNQSAHSWALGVTVPIPIYNRNQGNIMRAKLNVGQSQTELAGQIRQVIADVEQSQREFAVSRDAARRFETTLRPYAEKVLATSRERYERGEEDLIIFLAARTDYVAIVRQYLDVLIRHRRAMLDVNTAVGRRVFP